MSPRIIMLNPLLSVPVGEEYNGQMMVVIVSLFILHILESFVELVVFLLCIRSAHLTDLRDSNKAESRPEGLKAHCDDLNMKRRQDMEILTNLLTLFNTIGFRHRKHHQFHLSCVFLTEHTLNYHRQLISFLCNIRCSFSCQQFQRE